MTGLTAASNGDGTLTWTGTVSVGTAGKGRNLTLVTIDAQGVENETAASFTIDIIGAQPAVLSAEVDEKAVVNTPFALKIVTNTAATKLDVYNEIRPQDGRTQRSL